MSDNITIGPQTIAHDDLPAYVLKHPEITLAVVEQLSELRGNITDRPLISALVETVRFRTEYFVTEDDPDEQRNDDFDDSEDVPESGSPEWARYISENLEALPQALRDQVWDWLRAEAKRLGITGA